MYVWKIRQGNDLVDLQPVTMFNAHPKYLTRCLLSPDSKHLATCSADTTVKIWSTENYNYKLERVLSGHQRWVWDAAFSADSAYLVTASSDHVARLWDLHSGATVRQYSGHHRYVFWDFLVMILSRLNPGLFAGRQCAVRSTISTSIDSA